MNANYFVTIILAVKEWDPLDIQRLIFSLSSQKFLKKIQLVVVYSAASPAGIIEKIGFNMEAVKFIFSEPNGVYKAFLTGVPISDGEYIIFSGGDDFFMPGLSQIISIFSNNNTPDVIVSPVCFGNERLLIPPKTKLGIILKNWCQQGVLYRKELFKHHQFDSSYPIQADHKFNIELMGAELNIHYSKYISAYFSCGGISQTKPDSSFWKDMPRIVSKNFGRHYGVVCQLRKLVGYILYGRPDKRFKK